MKIITTCLLICSITLIKAQVNPATPNNGFESWTHVSSNGGYDDPDNWNCLNPLTAGFGTITCFKDSTSKHSGKYSAHLLTQQVLSIATAPGALTTGKINTGNYTISGGLPYTLRPDSIIGWYMYSSVSGDNGDCEFYLFGATHTDTIGQAFFTTPKSNVTTWTRFSLAITYTSSATPDTALWIFSSSFTQAGAQVGSQLYVDDLGLVIDSTTGIQNLSNATRIFVGPNPTTGYISINNGLKQALFNLVDITGRKVEEERIAPGTNYINLKGMPDGVYIYSLLDEQNTVMQTGKIVVEK
ncbi:MAG TPA: T9SS type A sorting domain-containing protein [Bacteroidia bacterium]|jgi:hypothetical protein|nr:T9SS type A sorting domain-containing protein [Bacteroidia bacterium]